MSNELLAQIDKILQVAVERGASDVFLTAGVPPSLKVNGEVQTLSEIALTEAHSQKLVLACMTQTQREDFLTSQECNFALVRDGIGRFRASAFVQSGSAGNDVRLAIKLHDCEGAAPDVDSRLGFASE